MRVDMKNRLLAGALALWIGCAPGAYAEDAATPAAGVQDDRALPPLPEAEVQKLLAAYALIKRNYIGQVDDKTLFEGALSGMLAALDPHSGYLDKDAMDAMDRENAGDYVGIGISVEGNRNQLRVVSTTPGSPAEHAGIVAGDLLMSVGGVAVAGMADDEVARRMHGAPGSVTTVGIAHGTTLRTLTLTRAALHDATVGTHMAAPGLAWIRISEFGGATGADLAAALKKLDGKEAPRGIVLDLRNDPGGLVSAAVAVAGAFLPQGSVVFTARGRESGATATVTVDQRYYRGPGEADILAGLPAWTRSVPLTVLVNGASASSAELVTGALQDHGRATVVGTRTFGKGSIQSVIPLDQDDGIKFTVARYFTPNGHEIQAHGVTPDVVVAPKSAADSELLLRESDLARHLPAVTDDPAAAGPADKDTASRNPAESTRSFGTRDDKALQAAIALLAPAEKQHGALAALVSKWRASAP
jgi:carboxyl-terminal processing protease